MEIRHLAVIGAGVMGRGVAHVAAAAGYHTVLYDVSQRQLDNAVREITANLDKGVSLGKVKQEERDSALAHLSVSTALQEAVAGADFVIEAIPEQIELKLELLRKLEEYCGPHTVFASNTSALSITEMASAVKNPGRVVGMHFFNPVHKMKLIELIRGLETSEETFRLTEQVSHRMGKETVEVNESPGFVTSRINVLIGNEAFYMLQEGVASARDIDKALKLGLNHPMGPFELVDLVGLDTRLSTLKFLHRTLGEKYRPCPLIEKYVKAGRLGRKVGKGVYDYTEGEKK